MKILVVSDTHGKNENLREVIDHERPDRIYHLGDGEGLEENGWMFTVPLEIVRGNCDWGSNLPSFVVLEVGRHVIFLAHGHQYNINYDRSAIIEAATQRGCDVILHGHTHVPYLDYISTPAGPVTIGNPGSLSFPRQESRLHTYMIIEVDSAGEFKYTLHSCEDL